MIYVYWCVYVCVCVYVHACIYKTRLDVDLLKFEFL